MLPRFNRNDLRTIANYLGMLVMIFGLIMLVPLVVSIFYAEWKTMCHYVFGMGIALSVGALMRLAKIDPQRMNRRHAIAITGLAWIICALFAAVPLYLSGHYITYLDAVFEGVSGLTATGLTLVQDIDHMSMADNMWRFIMQFVGGQGIIVIALSLGIFTRTGNSLYSTEGREESVVPNIMNTARFIWRFAFAVVFIGTAVMFVILLLGGMQPSRGILHALWITIGAYDTGGFSPGSLSLMAYHSWPLEIIAMLLMMFGALNFSLVAQVHKGNWREFIRDIEVRTLALWTTGMIVIFVAALAVGDFLTDFSGLMRRGVFTIVSATTNTGFQVLSTGQITTLLSSGAFFLVAVAMAVGGSSASTAGGIKALRVGMVVKGIGLRIRRILQPPSAQITTHYNHIGKHQLVPEMLSAALIIAALYIISYVTGSLVGVAFGYDALDSIFESISAASNAGFSSGIIKPGMPVALEVFYILQMWLGRLEFITLLALFATLVASILPKRKIKLGTPKFEVKDISGEDQSTEQGTKGYTKPLFVSLLAIALALSLSVALVFAPAQAAHASAGPALQSVSKSTSAAHALSTSILADTTSSFNAESNDSSTDTENTTNSSSTENTTSSSSNEDNGETSTISELAEAPEHLELTIVQVEGEVIGDILEDSEYVWISMSDGDNAISIYMPSAYRDQIVHVGSYTHDGTRLKIIGLFNLNCNAHDGLSDVHARSILEVTDEGGPREHTPNLGLLFVGVVLIVIGIAFVVTYNYFSMRRR